MEINKIIGIILIVYGSSMLLLKLCKIRILSFIGILIYLLAPFSALCVIISIWSAVINNQFFTQIKCANGYIVQFYNEAAYDIIIQQLLPAIMESSLSSESSPESMDDVLVRLLTESDAFDVVCKKNKIIVKGLNQNV